MLALFLTPNAINKTKKNLENTKEAISFVSVFLNVTNAEYDSIQSRKIRNVSNYKLINQHASWCNDLIDYIMYVLEDECKTLKQDFNIKIKDSLKTRWSKYCLGTKDASLRVDFSSVVTEFDTLCTKLLGIAREADDTGEYSDYSAYSNDDDDDDEEDDDDDDDDDNSDED